MLLGKTIRFDYSNKDFPFTRYITSSRKLFCTYSKITKYNT